MIWPLIETRALRGTSHFPLAAAKMATLYACYGNPLWIIHRTVRPEVLLTLASPPVFTAGYHKT
jgi:hypothetical protein